jgi:hypothetical protein
MMEGVSLCVRMRIDHHFAGSARNVDKRGYDLVQDLLAGKHELVCDGIVWSRMFLAKS